jgi:DNA-binding beta-propeller fold protein YncE
VDPVAVGLSPDGATAYVSDNAGGKVYAVDLPSLRSRWAATTGGRPGPIFAQGGSVWVSLYGAGQVAELDPARGSLLSRRATGPGPGQIVPQRGELYTAGKDGVWQVGGARLSPLSGFGLASAGGALWAAAYAAETVDRVADGKTVQLPAGLHPFWLSLAAGGGLLVAAERDVEDSDPGAVLSLEPPDFSPRVLLRAIDPDEVVEAGGRIFVAAHGAREVDVLTPAGGRVGAWARGSSPVAIAVDEPLKSLLVVLDERE